MMVCAVCNEVAVRSGGAAVADANTGTTRLDIRRSAAELLAAGTAVRHEPLAPQPTQTARCSLRTVE